MANWKSTFNYMRISEEDQCQGVLFFWGHHNNLPQTAEDGTSTMPIYFSTVLEARKRCGQGWAACETCRENPSPASRSFCHLLATWGCLGSWLCPSNPCLPLPGLSPVSFSVQIPLFLCRHQSCWIRAHSHLFGLILINFICKDPWELHGLSGDNSQPGTQGILPTSHSLISSAGQGAHFQVRIFSKHVLQHHSSI